MSESEINSQDQPMLRSELSALGQEMMAEIKKEMRIMNNAKDESTLRSELVDLRGEIRTEMTAEIKREIKREIEGSSLKDSSEREGLISDNFDNMQSLPDRSGTLLTTTKNEKYLENTQRKLEEIGIGGSPANMVPVRREIKADTEPEIEAIPIGHESSINEAVGTPPKKEMRIMNNAEDKPIPRSELVDLREEIRAEMTAEIKREVKREIEGSSLKDSSEREGLISDNSDYVHSLPGHSDTLLIAAQNQKYSENTLVSASRRQEIMQLQKEDIERMIRDGIQRRLEEIGIGGSPANMVPVRREIEADTELEIEVIPIGHERSINEAVGTPPSPPPQQHQRTGILGKCLSMAGRLLGVGSDSPRKDINTGTLGMYAVAVAVHPSACTNHRARAWLTAVMFLFFVMMETFVFLMVSLESVSPICNSVDDCLPGTYCYIEKGIKLGTCRDCAYGQKPDDKICSAIFSSEMWEKRDYAIDADYNTLPLGKTFLDLDKNYDKYQCLASHHCSETDVDAPNYTNNHCDYIVQNTDKIDGATYIVIAFFSLLWSLSICEDFEESTIEEMVLDHYIKDSLSGPATIIRIALCIQKYFIPFFATGSTIVLLITDPISAKSVILNLLAIGVLLEADNVIAVLFLNRQHEEIMEWAAGGVGDEVSIAARKSFFWTRVHGISCAVLLVIELSYIQNVKDCSDYFSSFIFGLYYFPPFVIFLWQFFVSVLCMRRNSPSIYKRMIEGLSELFFNLFVMSSQVFPSWIALTIRDDPFKNSSQFQSYYIWSIVCLLIFVGLLMLRRRCYRGAEMEQTEATDRSRMVRT